ncbi:MAG TPA: elongation factor G [Clostridiales bacterium]|nr:elongation factor G [Clostridiales bacterium]
MKDYTVEKLRNVCLLGHGGSGKTTLAEAMLFNTGVLDRFGKVPDGTTTTDFDPEEIKRKISINTAIAPCEWNGHKINVIDTPGFFDFIGELKQGLKVAESAVILVPGKGGVAVGTEKSWQYANEHGMSKVFYISKLDEENADFFEVVNQLVQTFGNKAIAFQIPIIENEKFTGIVDIVNMKAKRFEKDRIIEADIPSGMSSKVDELREALKEAVAETDEELMEKYFSGEEFTREEISKGLRFGILEGSIVPVLCGASINNFGVKPLMDAIIEYLPFPADLTVVRAKKAGSDETVELKISEDESFSALVFKTIADPFVGKITLFRVYSGTLTPDSVIYNSTTEKTEKIGQLFVLRGKKQIPTDKLIAGDIGGVAKLQNTNTNDTLSDTSKPVVLDEIIFPEPSITLAIEPKSKGDEEKISLGLQRLQEEDPTFRVEINSEVRQTLISGIGEQHIDVIISKLKSKFGVSVNLIDPKIPYRETIKKKVKAEGKHKKQTGGHGQYGHVWVEFEPGETEDLIFDEKVFGGAVPRQYFPAVEKGLRESISKGVLAGYPVVNLKATLVDGSFHPVDSSEMAFKIAASLAYKKGLEDASPVLLEPIIHVEVYVPDNYMGDIIGDLNKRRGRILGMNPQHDGTQQIVAEVPQAEMFKYATDLRSMTQARGSFKEWFERYEEVPPMISQKVIDEVRKATGDEGEDS